MITGRQVEVAIVDTAIPGDRDERPAHQPVDGTGVEAVGQLQQIAVEVAAFLQPAAEPAERRIGEGEKAVKNNAPLALGIPLELLLGCQLVGRQERPRITSYNVCYTK